MMITRRERLRTATAAEIKGLARRLLVAGGPPAISLRAIAREMGMTAPAIYRYFPSLDGLIAGLTEDLYAELTAAVETVRVSTDQPLDQLTTMARAFRQWSLAHPAEFGLMFGNPVPGVALFEGDCFTPDHAAARFGAPFLAAFATLYAQQPFPTPPTELLEAHLGDQLAPIVSNLGQELPVQVIYAYLAAWTRFYGLVAMEVFGHMRWATDDVSPLFELELAAFVAQMRGVD